MCDVIVSIITFFLLQVIVTSTSLEHAGESGELSADVALPGVRDIILAKTFVTFSKLHVALQTEYELSSCVSILSLPPSLPLSLSLSLSLPPSSWLGALCHWFGAMSGQGFRCHY